MNAPRPQTPSKPAKSRRKFSFELKCSEFRVICLREDYLEDGLGVCEDPEHAAAYFREHIATSAAFNPDVETMFVLLLNARRRPKGHCLISTGTLDTVLIHPREVFRPAFVSASAAIILFHNHPSGDPSPSEADIMATRDLIRAGQILKIDLLDHLIMGRPHPERADFVSLKEMGYFHGERRASKVQGWKMSACDPAFVDLIQRAQRWKSWSDAQLAIFAGCPVTTLRRVLALKAAAPLKVRARLKQLIDQWANADFPKPREIPARSSSPLVAAAA